MNLDDVTISQAILDAYVAKFRRALVSDVVIVGAGPSGLTAARLLAGAGAAVTIVEKKLAPGGGIWGGGMAMNEVIVQPDAAALVEAVGVRAKPADGGNAVVDAVELAAALTLEALRAGATIFNLVSMEDVRVQGGRVTCIVVNATAITTLNLHVDPLTLGARAVIDGTGHDAAVAAALEKHRIALDTDAGTILGEGPMDADTAEAFVVDHTGAVYPGLYLAGMAVCAANGGPRMGPIFGGMLLSGERVAAQVAEDLGLALP